MRNGKLFLTLFITIIVLILGLKISKVNPKSSMNLMQDKDSR